MVFVTILCLTTRKNVDTTVGIVLLLSALMVIPSVLFHIQEILAMDCVEIGHLTTHMIADLMEAIASPKNMRPLPVRPNRSNRQEVQVFPHFRPNPVSLPTVRALKQAANQVSLIYHHKVLLRPSIQS